MTQDGAEEGGRDKFRKGKRKMGDAVKCIFRFSECCDFMDGMTR